MPAWTPVEYNAWNASGTQQPRAFAVRVQVVCREPVDIVTHHDEQKDAFQLRASFARRKGFGRWSDPAKPNKRLRKRLARVLGNYPLISLYTPRLADDGLTLTFPVGFTVRRRTQTKNTVALDLLLSAPMVVSASHTPIVLVLDTLHFRVFSAPSPKAKKDKKKKKDPMMVPLLPLK